MNVISPMILDSSGNVLRRIDPVDVSLDLQLEPLSSAEIELKPGDTIPERSWVSVYTEHGLAGIFRSRPQRDRYGERSSRVSLVHGAVELNDYLTTKGGDQEQDPANTAIAYIMQFYLGTHWRLGTVSATSSVVYQLNGSGVLDAITEIMEQLPGYMLVFDQSVTPWTLNVLPRPETVSAEGRLSRNISSVEISRDDSSLCTRVYYGENDLFVEDAAAIQKYGVIEYRINDSGLTNAQLAAIAQAYLDNHKASKLSVSISAIDFYNATGEPLDRIALGSKYRLAIPDAETEENRVIEAIICSIRYDSVFSNNPQITLASDPDTIITFLKKQRRSGGSARQIAKEEADKQYQHWTTENEVYKESVYKILGVELNPDGTVKYVQAKDAQGNPIYDEQGNPVWETDSAGNPVPVYNEDSEGSLGGSVKQTAQDLTSLYTKTGVASLPAGVTNLFSYTSNIKQTAESIQTEVTAARGTSSSLGDRVSTLSSQISQQADKISLVVTSTTQDGQTTNSINTAGIILAINGGGQGASSATISADKIDLQGYVTASELFVEDALTSQNTIYANDLVLNEGIYCENSEGESTLGVVSATSLSTEIIHTSELYIGTDDTPLGNVVTGFGTVTPDPTTGEITIPYSTFDYPTAGSNNQNINFNIADMAFYQNHVGINSATLFAYSDDPLDYADWTKDATGTLVNKYGLIKVVTNKDPNDFYFIGIDASSGTGGTASIDDITAQSITPDQTRTTVTIKATGTNVSDRTEDAVLSNTTYTDGGYTYPCVNLTLDNTVIGRISTQSTYTSGETAGKNATNVVKGTWSQGSITYTTDAPTPNASAPKTLTLTTDQNSWTWTAGDGDSGNYQKQVYVKDSAVTNPILTEPVDMPDTKVVVESKTKQNSWWKTTGDNAYKYVIPAFSATDYLSTDSSNQHSLATGTNDPTVIDPSEAIAHGFGICHDSISLSESTQTLAAGASVTVYPKAKATKDAESATNITTAGITITAASAVVPKVSRGNWSSGSLTFTAGTTGELTSSVKIWEGATDGSLDSATTPTKISFDIYEDTGNNTKSDTGADIYATVTRNAASLSLGTYDSTNSKFTVSKSSGGSVTVGNQVIQVGVTPLDIPVTIGSNVIGDPHYEGDGVYSLSATGTITVGSQGLTVSGTDTFTATDAIALGLRQAGENLTVSQTNQPSYDSARNVPEVSIDSNGYYFVKIGSTSYKKFHAPSGGSGSSDRTATYLEKITLTAPQNPEQDFNWTFDVGSIAHYENPTSVGTVNTNVQIDASAIYQAGIAAVSVSGTVDVNKSEWTTVNGASTCFFMPSKGTGQGSSVSITADVTSYQTVYEAGSTANVKIKDRDEVLQEKTFWLRKISTADKSYVVLTNTMSLVPRDYMAKYEIEDGGGEQTEQYTVTSIDPITLTAYDISSSVTKYPVLRYNDPSQSTDNTVPLQIDASAVYSKGLTDGSRLNIEELRTITQPLTQNTTYTFKPSDYKDVMRAITFDVNVPVGVQSSGIIQTDTESTYNGWTYDNSSSIDEKYCRVRINPYGTEAYYFKIDAHELYEKGVAYGADTAGYRPVEVDVSGTENKFSQIDVPTGTDTVKAVTGSGAIYQVDSNGSLYLTATTISRTRYGYLYEWNDSTNSYQRVSGTGLGSWFYVGSNVTEVLAKSNLKVSLASTASYTVATGSRKAYITNSNGKISFWTAPHKKTYYEKTT